MEIFINEVSLEGQYTTEEEFKNAINVFISIFDLIQKIKTKEIYQEPHIYANYEAIKGSNFLSSLYKLKDKSRRRYFIDKVFNKTNTKSWRDTQVHSSEDLFDCCIDNNYKNINDTTLAEVSERKIQNKNQEYLLINFILSSFSSPHPNINNCCFIKIIKNSDEINYICLDSIDNRLALESWLKYLNIIPLDYPVDATEPPRDEQTILKDTERFQKTSHRYDGRAIYCELATGCYWYVDNLHSNKAAHLEVFDKTGKHLGEADLEGNLDESKSEQNKKINIS
jgi:hypothetical protein